MELQVGPRSNLEIAASEVANNGTDSHANVTLPITKQETRSRKGLIDKLAECVSGHKRQASSLMSKWYKLLLLGMYNAYLVVAISLTWHKTPSYSQGVKFLAVVTAIGYFFALYYLVIRDYLVLPIVSACRNQIKLLKESSKWLNRNLSLILWTTFIALVVAYCIIITRHDRYRLVSGLGVIGFVAFGFALSEHRSQIKWTQVLWGLSLQFVMALVVLRTTMGQEIFQCIGDKVTEFLKFTDEGSGFVFGYLVSADLKGIDGLAPVFAFKILPVIMFFSFFVAILYYYGVMQVIVSKSGWLLQSIIGTTACESLNAAANVFLGMTEAPLIIKPYIGIMTKSELFAVMTGGFATIAGAVLAAYINFGVSATHLLSASVMAAPSALGVSKLFYPETEESLTQADNLPMEKGTERNAIEAAANGASQAIKLCSNIVANMIAFLAFIKFMDTMCLWLGSNVDIDDFSFQWILSKLFIPVALIMGVEWADCEKVAKLIGLKTLVNEFVAYKELTVMMDSGLLSDRSTVIATYALCGFSNFSAIGVAIGGLGSMAPERRSDLAAIALKSMIAGSTVTFISASMAGLLVDVQPIAIQALTNGTLSALNSTLV